MVRARPQAGIAAPGIWARTGVRRPGEQALANLRRGSIPLISAGLVDPYPQSGGSGKGLREPMPNSRGQAPAPGSAGVLPASEAKQPYCSEDPALVFASSLPHFHRSLQAKVPGSYPEHQSANICTVDAPARGAMVQPSRESATVRRVRSWVPTTSMAPAGHSAAHIPHPWHTMGSILNGPPPAGIFTAPAGHTE